MDTFGPKLRIAVALPDGQVISSAVGEMVDLIGRASATLSADDRGDYLWLSSVA